LFRSGQQLGPYPEELLKKLHADGQLQAGDLVWEQASQSWLSLDKVFRPSGLPTTPASASQPTSSPEPVFLQEGVVTVTKSRFVTGSQTFLLSGVTSIRAIEITPSLLGFYLVLLFGLFFVVAAISCLIAKPPAIAPALFDIVVAALVIGMSLLYRRSLKPRYSVILTTAAQEVKALTSRDRGLIERVVDALDKAVIARG